MFYFEVHTTKDSADALTKKLDFLTRQNGRIVSVMWKPERSNPKDILKPLKSSYAIVVEFTKPREDR